MTDGDPVQAEIDDLQRQVRVLMDRIDELRKLRSFPYVEPVQVYWRHYVERREPYDGAEDGDGLKGAYRMLEYMADDGQCAPIGVEIGGFLIKQNELRDRFGYVD